MKPELDPQWQVPRHLKQRKVTKLWTKKDGTKIRICDMSNSHIVNTLRMLERQAEGDRDMPYPRFNGDMAQMYAEEEWADLQSQPVSHFYPIYDDLLAELARRSR